MALLHTAPPPGLTEFYLQLEIRYDPVLTDQAPIRAGTCPTRCEASAIREGFRLRFRPLREAPSLVPGAPGEEVLRTDPGWPSASLLDVFPLEPREDVRHRLLAQQRVDLAALAVPPHDRDLPWVALGILRCEVTWGPNQTAQRLRITNVGRYYRQLFGNDSLSRLVFGLAERVDEAARVRILTFAPAVGPDASGEGQTANVYQPLGAPLRVQVIDSRLGGYDAQGRPFPPADLASVRVRFQVLGAERDYAALLSKTEFDPTKPYDPSDGAASQDVDVDPDTGTASVWWRLGKAPGLHTVVARIIPARVDYPPLHPGSQVVFRATARPTAPTIVGMEWRHWYHHHGGCIRWRYGHATLRVFFSRKVDVGELQSPDGWLRVWRMVWGREAPRAGGGPPLTLAIPLGPERVPLEPHGEPAAVGESPDEEACWYADYRLPNLLTYLCEDDTLRILVMIRPTDELASDPSGFDPPRYPTPQQLDADFDGSFLSPPSRDHLWDGGQDADDALATAEDYYTHAGDWTRLPDVTPDQADALHAVWHRFQPREHSLPSGDGQEGGEFHKAFELRLPNC